MKAAPLFVLALAIALPTAAIIQPSPALAHPSPVIARPTASLAANLQAGAGSATSRAQSIAPLPDELEARAQALEGRLKCPVCRTQSVRESTSFMALEMRLKIRELIAAGASDEAVLDYFVTRYGDYILLAPRKQGFGLAAYAFPLLAVLAAAVFLALAIRRRRGASARPVATASESSALPGASLRPEERDRVERELKRYTV